MAAASYGVASIRTFVLERMQTDYAKVSLPAVCLRAVQGEAYVFLQDLSHCRAHWGFHATSFAAGRLASGARAKQFTPIESLS